MKTPEYTEDGQLVVLTTRCGKVAVEITDEIKESLEKDIEGTLYRLKKIVLGTD